MGSKKPQMAFEERSGRPRRVYPRNNRGPKALEERYKNLEPYKWKKGQSGDPGNVPADEWIPKDEVIHLAALGATQKEIGDFYGVSDRTIRRHFKREIEKGHEKMRVRIRSLQMKSAEKGSNAMLIWLGKQYLGQSEKQEVDVSHQIKDLLTECGYVDDPLLTEGEKADQGKLPPTKEGAEQVEVVQEVGVSTVSESEETSRE